MTFIAAVIVVAGGRSTRFGADKLRHRIDGRTLLQRTVDAAAAVGDVVLVSAADEIPAGVSVAVSESPRWGGPCAAIAAGVDAAGVVDAAADALILPADLADPWSTVAALTGIDQGVLTDADGHPQWLSARAPLAALTARVAELRRGRATLAGLSARDLLGGIRGRHRVSGFVCADIDTPDDLPAFPAVPEKEPVHGTV
ncbi:NTP transferase domain-containing protein [Leifsonia sp. fls2-241-R2A-40a]|uniref:molybdenum cofactor guanylyltransferase n=1 Tax=Leifsonia sp. fls2-241-R2A-40a TaxID=3040290 RepID=UPI00254C38C9|nr:NTP transferase domain-containing protein [Leifsonia sp. fls2-241-R2A-40a]